MINVQYFVEPKKYADFFFSFFSITWLKQFREANHNNLTILSESYPVFTVAFIAWEED